MDGKWNIGKAEMFGISTNELALETVAKILSI
jgi:hypothetical protein